MAADDHAYFRRRVEDELERSQQATDPMIAGVHFQFAKANLAKLPSIAIKEFATSDIQVYPRYGEEPSSIELGSADWRLRRHADDVDHDRGALLRKPSDDGDPVRSLES